MATANNTALTDDQIIEIQDNLLGANPDLIKLGSVNTRLVSTQVNEIAKQQASYDAILLSSNMVNLGPTEIALENAKNAFYMTLSELFSANEANEIYAETKNIAQEVHPLTGQEMEYQEIAGRTYFMQQETTPATTPDNVVAFQAPVAGMTAPVLAADTPVELPKLTDDNAFARASAPLNDQEADVEPATVTNFSWDDDAILSTYEGLLKLNPESVVNASAITQEAYARVQPALDLQIQHNQYNHDPAAWVRNGNLPPSEEALIKAEDTAYNHLAELSTTDGQALSIEVSKIVTSDADNDLTPPPPEIIAGQQYLKSIGLNESGTAFLEVPSTDSAPVINVTPDDPTITNEPQSLPNMFVSAAHAETPNIDTTPYKAPAEEVPADVANTNAEPTNLSFGNIDTTNGGIAEFTTSQNLSFGDIAEGSSIDSMMANFDTATLGVSANTNAEPTSTPYEVQSGDTLTHIIETHYGLDPNEAYRASLIIGAANGLENANRITPGQSLSLPSMDILQQAAGTDDLRLRNLSSHPNEIGSKVNDLMNNDAPAQVAQQGAAYAFPIGAAAAPSV